MEYDFAAIKLIVHPAIYTLLSIDFQCIILPLYRMTVYLFVRLFPNSSQTAEPIELKFSGKILLGMQMVLGLRKLCLRKAI